MTKTRLVNVILIALLIVSFSSIIIINSISSITGIGNASACYHGADVSEAAAEITHGAYNDLDKATQIYDYMIENYSYDYEYSNLLQTINVSNTLKTKKGVCIELSAVFAAMCHEVNIECYMVDANEIGTSNYHTWNRFCVNGQWYDVDLTNDICSDKPLKFMKLENGKYSDSQKYHITRIYA